MNNHHIAVRRIAGLAVLAAGLGIGSALPITAFAEANSGAEPARQVSARRQKDRGLIRFASGATSGSVNGAVARGDWHHWGARAQRGQTIEVTVSATAGNATFELYTPSGDQMADDVTSFRGQLPASGLFAIDVGSTGGLANYTLHVSITGRTDSSPAGPVRQRSLPGPHPGGRQRASRIGPVTRWREATGTSGRSRRPVDSRRSCVSRQRPTTRRSASTHPNGDVLAAHTTVVHREAAGDRLVHGRGRVHRRHRQLHAGPRVRRVACATGACTCSRAGSAPSHFQGNIRFAAGASSGSVEWHRPERQLARVVVQGDFAGQSMTLTVSAAGGNATFSVYEPDGDPLAAHTTSFTGTLPATGFYMIEVGPAGGGSADYTLNLSIT